MTSAADDRGRVPGDAPADLAHDEVAQTLLKAASDVLAADGAKALTVRRIATDAGVSTMNVYSRFGGKDGIVEHLYIEGFSRLREAMLKVPETADTMADLSAAGVAYRRFALENPTYYSVMFDRAVPHFRPSPAAQEQASKTLQLLADGLERAMNAGALPHADPLHTAAAVWATCHGVVSLELKAVGPPALDWARVYATATTGLVLGLIAGGPPAWTARRGRPAG
jgi:AcrR family transcriptional regulator